MWCPVRLKAGDKVGGKARVRADVKADVKAGVKAGDKAGVGNVRLGKMIKDKDNVWLGTGGDVWSQKDDKDDSKGDGKK